MHKFTRRKLFTAAGIGLAAGLTAPMIRWGIPVAEAAERLDPENSQAKALGYHHDSAEVDENKWPRHQASQHCATCNLAQNVDSDGEWIGCQIFPGKQVNRNGWCSTWVQAAK